jgi:hypothetical protein
MKEKVVNSWECQKVEQSLEVKDWKMGKWVEKREPCPMEKLRWDTLL